MALAGSCMKNRRCRIMGSRAGTPLAGGNGLGDRTDGQYGRRSRRVLEDRWTAVTVDGSLSAHFEHTIAIQPSGPPSILSRL